MQKNLLIHRFKKAPYSAGSFKNCLAPERTSIIGEKYAARYRGSLHQSEDFYSFVNALKKIIAIVADQEEDKA
jgi:hypothetical protein